ncbi:MAG: hypothetical protein EPN91_02275 [Salinibacterium sp.]|nr:MAG: hypothetical protein EPN91_02275 [Salinibacterium sp.]
MKKTLLLKMALEDGADMTAEFVRALRLAADRIESGEDVSFFKTIFTSDGEDVGRFAVKEEWYFRA